MSSLSPPRRTLPPPTAYVRGRYMKTFVAHLEQLPEMDRKRIAAAVPDSFFHEIDESGMFAWLPFDRNLVLTRAVAGELGPRRTHDFFLSLMLASFQTPLLRGLVEAVLRLKGNDPTVMLQWVSKGFELMFKDAGTWRVVDRESRAAALEVLGLPADAVRDRVWLDSVASSLGALFTFADARGVVVVRDVEPERGRVVFRMRWEMA
jgi:hypothetical protein